MPLTNSPRQSMHKLGLAFTLLLANLVICLSVIAPVAFAQSRFDNSIMSRNFPIRLLGGINTIAQDGLGFIWFAGENGLGKYDGVTLRVYQADGNPGSLPGNYVWDIAVDLTGQLWVATSNALCIYNPDTDKFDTIESIGGQPLLYEIITSLHIKENKVYVGSTRGLNIIDLHTQTIAAYIPQHATGDARPSNTIHNISIDKSGNIWVATEFGGVARLDKDKGTFIHYFHDKKNPASIRSNHVRSIYHDSKDRMWVGTYGAGAAIFRTETNEFVPVDYPQTIGNSRTSVVVDIIEDSQGDIWISTDQHGLLRFNQDLSFKHRFRHSVGDNTSLIAGQTRTLFEDKNHDLWIGMFPYGVSFLDRSKDNIKTYKSDENNPQTLSHSSILSFLQDNDGTIWVGTEGGLNALDPSTGLFTRYTSNPANPHALAANPVLAITEDAQNNLWLGTWSGGLHRFDKQKKVFHRYQPHPEKANSLGDAFVWAVYKDSFNTIWVGTETGGLQYYRPDTDDFGQFLHDPNNPNSLVGNYVRDIIEDHQQRLWVATSAGLSVLNLNTRTFQPLSLKTNGIISLSFYCIFEDSRGYIWAGGNDRGVVRINPVTGETIQLDVRNGLPSSTISSIREDHSGYIWLATYNGLARLHPDSFAIMPINIEHGLIGATFNRDASLLDAEGRLYFGSAEGISAFKPEDMEPKKNEHPLIITNFRILNKEVIVGKEGSPLKESIMTTASINLDHKDTMFSFDFVLLNYRNTILNTYAYRLDGFDKNWHYVGQSNTATYTNLDPGHYTFHVKAKAPGEEWQTIKKPLGIYIAPPPWKSWWAYCLYLLAIFALAYAIRAVKRLQADSDTYRELSLHDSLAGTYNRAGVAQVVKRLFANENTKSHVCIMLMDIDYFKQVNDTRGHTTGDHVIKELARITQANIRADDCFGRWGGEEFILICQLPSTNAAYNLAEKIRVAVALHEFDPADSLHVTISIGITLVQAKNTFDEALERADKALYHAKATGRNRSILAETLAK